MTRIHIVGVSGRTGTTLLAECMRCCFEIDGFEEHEAPLTRMKSGVNTYLTKHPHGIKYLNPRMALDPRLYVICMMRDPRDVIVSRHGKNPDSYFTSLQNWKRHSKIVDKFKNHERFLVVKYEDLIRNPDDIQSRIATWIPGLTITLPFSAFHDAGEVSQKSQLALNGVRPIDSGNASKWRKHLPRVKEQIELHGDISEDLKRWGYETDDSWLGELDGVEAGQFRQKAYGRAGAIKRAILHGKHLAVDYPASAMLAATYRLFSINRG